MKTLIRFPLISLPKVSKGIQSLLDVRHLILKDRVVNKWVEAVRPENRQLFTLAAGREILKEELFLSRFQQSTKSEIFYQEIH